MAMYDASKEFKPFEKKDNGNSNAHPRPRKGATAKKRAREQAARERLGAEKKQAPAAPQKGGKKK